jgi:pimeloyl-ACP methyl ester carboxylesterase
MQIYKRSFFKDPYNDILWFNEWAHKVEAHSGRKYEHITLETPLGKTHVWGFNTTDSDADILVIFPGARTSPLFWDLDNGLDNIGCRLKIYMVETNGLPNNSDGGTPDIKSDGYGHWANDILQKLGIEKAFVAGASFGGLIAMKLCLVNPLSVKAVFLLNPGCLQPFSLSVKNLYYNLLPILSPSRKNIALFLDKAVFCKPTHQLSARAESLLIDYELFALTRYKDNTQKPYYMNNELTGITTDTYLLEGNKDLLFPHEKSIDNALRKISSLKEVIVFENVGHGIETYAGAMNFIGTAIKGYK